MQWLRRSFIAGFFVTVPLVISVAAFVWIFRLIDGFVGPLYDAVLDRHVPGLGIVTTALFVLLAGAFATNVIGKRLLQQAEAILLRVPVFRTIYAPVKQLVVAFSPDNEFGFKRVVIIEEPMVAVYVPTNHLYLGDVVVCTRNQASFPDITVEQGIRVFLTGGMALSTRVRARRGDDRVRDFRV